MPRLDCLLDAHPPREDGDDAQVQQLMTRCFGLRRETWGQLRRRLLQGACVGTSPSPGVGRTRALSAMTKRGPSLCGKPFFSLAVGAPTPATFLSWPPSGCACMRLALDALVDHVCTSQCQCAFCRDSATLTRSIARDKMTTIPSRSATPSSVRQTSTS